MTYVTETRALAATVFACAFLSACGNSSLTAAGTGTGASPQGGWQETWQGGAATVSNPAALPPELTACQTSADPSCDVHQLVVPAGVRQVLVAIKPDQDSATPEDFISTNDYDIYVYDDQNTLVSYYGDADGDESLVFETTGAAYYEVRVAAYTVAPGNTFTAVAREVSGQPIDIVADCLEAVPASVGLSGITDAAERVQLSVALLLDGTNQQRAMEVMAKAAESYAPLNIDLVVSSVTSVKLKQTDSTLMIEEVKQVTGGVPPGGADVAVAFTNKEMQAYDPSGQAATVIGQADCLGGIRWPQHSYAVVTDVSDIEDSELIAGFNWNMDAAAETMAHEIGHLMGAHHHYGNCVEGNLSSAGPQDVSPCTLMFPAVNGASLNFSALEGLVVRGHAVDYAMP
jgi:hypothetical protein